MSQRAPSSLFSLDGTITHKDLGRLREQNGAPAMHAVLHVEFRSDLQEGIVRNLSARPLQETIAEITAFVRSGWAQAGIDITLRPDALPRFRAGKAEIPVTIASLRGTANDHLLHVLRTVIQAERQKVQPGGILVTRSEDALRGDEIHAEVRQQKLLLPDGTDIGDDGMLSIPLDKGYVFGEEIFDEEAMRRLFRDGRGGIQHLRKAVPLPKHLPPGAFLLASMKGLSLGRTHGVIQRPTNQQSVEHLGAFNIDPLRTMGLQLARQAEIINKSEEAVSVSDLRVRMKLYQASEKEQSIAARVVNPQTVREGITLPDLIPLEQLMRVVDVVSAHKPSTSSGETSSDTRPYGLLISRGRSAAVPWASQSEFQGGVLKQRARIFLDAHPSQKGSGWVDGQGIPDAARPVTEQLGYVSQDHHGRMLVTDGFPEPDACRELLRDGIGVFVARSLHAEHDAFTALENAGPRLSVPENHDSPLSTDARSMKQHALFFGSMHYQSMRELSQRGATFFMVLRDMEDEMARDEIIPAHIREFHRGLWVKPEAKEQLNAVRTIIAMYGSHVHGMEPILQGQLETFMCEMKEIFGEEIGITHGKGPGMMKMADDAAAQAGITRIAVGICVEGQAGNCRPEAMVDFHDADRLTRQKFMDDLATIKMFNIGGAGTLEEGAITLCSQKLGKKSIAPIIFVDPLGLGRNGGNLWQQLHEQVKLLAEEKTITVDEANNAQIHLRLLQASAPHYIHCVSSYEEATRIIRGFQADPAAYYQACNIPAKEVLAAHAKEAETLSATGFERPSFLADASKLTRAA